MTDTNEQNYVEQSQQAAPTAEYEIETLSLPKLAKRLGVGDTTLKRWVDPWVDQGDRSKFPAWVLSARRTIESNRPRYYFEVQNQVTRARIPRSETMVVDAAIVHSGADDALGDENRAQTSSAAPSSAVSGVADDAGASSSTALAMTQQMALARSMAEELVRPHVDAIERLTEKVAEQAEEIGRLKAELEQGRRVQPGLFTRLSRALFGG